jgi:hypothetical protein
MPPETVSVEVALPPDSGPPTTDHTSPSPVVVVSPTAPSGDATTADLLARVRALEEKNEELHGQVLALEASVLTSMLASTPAESTPEETTTDPDSETPEEIVVPESSDDGPRATPEKAKAKKPAWHHWI